MRKRNGLRKTIAGLSAFAFVATSFVPVLPAQAEEPKAVGEIAVNPEMRYQTLKGWGTSLCWWGNSIGSWGDKDFNDNGTPDREEIAELVFSPEYLNLNIVRYNVGGGDKADTSIKRCEGLVPGWTEDMTGSKDGSSEFLGDEFYQKDTESMADAGQLWMLEQANEYRADSKDIVNEVFSNSPPYYMTKSGSSTGGYWNDLNNLKDDQYDEFTLYLARAAKWIDSDLKEKYGTGVDFIEPLNEPDTNYWQDGSTKQEGCIFNTGELQSKAYTEMRNALTAEGLDDIQITGTDETSLWNGIQSFNRLDDQVKKDMTTIGVHTYGGNDNERKELKNIAKSYDKDLWMSEVTKGGGSHWDGCHESMDEANTKSQSEGIMADLKQMQSSAWIAWLAADSEYECLQTNSNWGLLHAVFETDGPVPDYHTNLVDGDGKKLDWVPESGYWSTTKQFYTMMQYSKYLKAGYTMIEIEDGNMCAAISPEGDELVVVAQNYGDERNTTLDLKYFPGAAAAEVYRTSDTESCELKETQDVKDKVLDVTMPTNSVTTYVVKAAEGKELFNPDNYAVTVDADVVKPESDWTSDVSKFTYQGSWGESDPNYGGGKYTTDEDTSVTFTFEGEHVAVYGTKESNGAIVNVSVDGGDSTEVSLFADQKDGNALICDTGKLENGRHTITISKADGQNGKLIEINNAQIITGELTDGSAGELPDTDPAGTLTKEKIEENDYVLYTVNCGTPDTSVIPNPDSERMGLLQSKLDQKLDEDEKTGMQWGMDAATEFSKGIPSGDDATDIGNSFVYMADDVEFNKDKSKLSYTFDVPTEEINGIEKDVYEVTVAFKHFWDKRLVNVSLEDKTVATDIELKSGDWVSRTFTTEVKDGQLNVAVKSPRRTSAKEDPILNYIKVRAVKDTEPAIPNYTSITGAKGETMYDTEGKQIQAHGGQVQQFTVDGVTKWYWIGEDKTYDYRPCGGIRVYSSEDLYNWKDEGSVLRTMESMSEFEDDSYFKDLYKDYSLEDKERIFVDIDKNNCVMERPKMLYNEKNDNYVIWFHADGRYPGSDADYGKAKAGIAVSDSPAGPFKMVGSYKLNYVEDADHGYDSARESWGSVRDMNLFKDSDGTAYVIYSSDGNKTTFISKLNEDYTWLAKDPDEAVEGVDFTRNFENWSREAPAMFQYKDKYFMVNSGCTGWSPNPAQYAVADHPMGPWTSKGDPCTDWGKETTYDTQSTCVFPVDAENGKFIYMGDRWNAGDLSESRYVWLPVEFTGEDQLALRRHEDWTLDALQGNETLEVKSELPETATSVENILEVLPNQLTVSFGKEDIQADVEWKIEDYDSEKVGIIPVTATIAEYDHSFTHKINVINPDTIYFFDSGADTSKYHELAVKELGSQLLNQTADQKFSEENKAGYVGVTEAENSEEFDMGRHDGGKLNETGWWAAADKKIQYDFKLEPGKYTVKTGFQEWWNTTRELGVTVSAGEDVMGQQDFTLTGETKDMQQNISFTLEEESVVAVTIDKKSSADPVLSWISVQKEKTTIPEEVDKTTLKAAIEEAESLKEDDYTSVSFAAFKQTLTDAKTVYENEEATKDQVDAAAGALKSAKDTLVTVASVLKAGISENLIEEDQKALYTEESWGAYAGALKAAQDVLASGTFTEKIATDMLEALKTAKASLVLAEEPGGGDEPGTGNNQGTDKKDPAKADGAGTSVKSVKTGDTTPVFVLFGICAGALVVTAVCVKRTKKAK